ncbi:MAG: AAA family ATPase [bacterium]
MSLNADLSIQLVWAIANTEANLSGEKRIRPIHFYLGILKLVDPRFLKQLHGVDIPEEEQRSLGQLSKDVRHYLEMTVDEITKLRRALRSGLREGTPEKVEIHMLHRSDDSRKVFLEAGNKVIQAGGKSLSVLQLAEALFESGAISLDGLKRPHGRPSSKGAKWEVVNDGKPDNQKKYSEWFGRNLLKMAIEGTLPPFEGREREIKTILRVLSRTRKRHIAIIGDPGVGKTALVEGLAKTIAEKKVPVDLHNSEVLELHGSDISADCKSEAEINRRISHVFHVLENHKRAVLLLDDFHGLFPSHLKHDATVDLLTTLLAEDNTPVIITTLPGKWAGLTASAPSLLRHFEVINITDPSEMECKRVAEAWVKRIAESQRINFAPKVLEAIISAAAGLSADRALIDRIVDLIENAATYVKVSAFSSNDARRDVTTEVIASVLTEHHKVRSVRAPRSIGENP